MDRLANFCRRYLHAVTLTFDHLTLSVCASGVMWYNSVLNGSEIEQYAIRLQRFKDLTFRDGLHLVCHGRWISKVSIHECTPRIDNALTFQIWAKWNNTRLSNWWRNHFPSTFSGSNCVRSRYHWWVDRTIPYSHRGHWTFIGFLKIRLVFRHFAVFRNQTASEATWWLKIKSKFRTFDPLPL